MKLLFALLFMIPAFASAEVEVEEARKQIVGRYQFETDGGEMVKFIVRSSDTIEVVSENAEGQLTWLGSANEDLLDGLPVAHIVIAVGSDEDVMDYHFFLAAEGVGENLSVSLLGGFTTFNDGPNDISRTSPGPAALQKYNKNSKRLEDL